eukprot:1601127-Prymnesium_polylepis.1
MGPDVAAVSWALGPGMVAPPFVPTPVSSGAIYMYGHYSDVCLVHTSQVYCWGRVGSDPVSDPVGPDTE